MEKQPISIMIHDLNPWGGQDRSMLEIAWQLNKSFPLEIHSYSLEGYQNWPDMTHVKYESLIKKPIIFKYLSYHWQSRRRVRQHKPALVQSTGTASLLSDVVQVQFIHHSWQKIQADLPKDKGKDEGFFRRHYHNWLSNYKLTLEKRAYTPEKHYVAISHGIKKELMEHFGIPAENIEIIYHGVDSQHFSPWEASAEATETRKRLRKELGYHEDDVVLLFVGALNSRKGILKALETMALLKASDFNHCQFLAVGAGDQKLLQNTCEKLNIADSVKFRPHSRDIREFYWAADVFFLPTYYEPFGLVVLEAMSCGLPIITSITAGAAELMTDGREGYLIDPKASAEAIVKKAQPLLQESEVRKQMGHHGREVAMAHTWEQVGQDYRSFYNRLLKQN